MEKKLRTGYTTGTCAAGATKAALTYLRHGDKPDSVFLKSLNGKDMTIPINSLKMDSRGARASVIKFAGDDPDVTNGIVVCARVALVEEFQERDLKKGNLRLDGSLLITGGRGVGLVTRKGIQSEIGKYAINPGPLEMITQAVTSVLVSEKSPKKILVKIFVPEGIERGKKTLNNKLGIVGGISILGTTGIVKPMSEEALKQSLYVELKVIRENWEKDWVVFVFGNYGERFCNSMGINSNRMVVISNFIGFMLDSALSLGFKRVILVGHIGKGVKVAGGIFHTHSRVADARLEIMAANGVLVGEPLENIKKVLGSNTVDEACHYIEKKELFTLLAQKTADKCTEYTRGEIGCQSLLFSFSGDVLGYSKDFYKMAGEIIEEN
ncbi:MAG: cobalt-precorrin-5B (C(1))-methyltransferase CbiD [Fusobacteriaceae bacterium]